MIILGASARAAAASALRAGFAPWCADLFADADLARACPVRRVELADYPRGLVAAAREAPPGPWLYTGALENRPDIIAKIDRPLWGNSPQVLRRVRNPFLLARALFERGLPCPIACSVSPQATPPRRFLVKPFHSAGGSEIHWFAPDTGLNPRRHYLQEWIEGEPCSAVFVSNSTGRIRCLGATQQLIGTPWLAAAPFQWCGNIGPIDVPPTTLATLHHIAEALATTFELRGLYGIDYILRDGVPWPVEVNPRYPASLEVLERATGEPYMAMHAEAFRANIAPPTPPAAATARFVGKAVLYARQSFAVPDWPPWHLALARPLDDLASPFADLPASGTRIDQGQPICSIFAGADSLAECQERLRCSVADVQRRLAC